MLDLDAGLISDLDIELGLILGLDARLRRRRGFSVIGCRPVGRTRSDIRVWGWGLGLGSGYPGVN